MIKWPGHFLSDLAPHLFSLCSLSLLLHWFQQLGYPRLAERTSMSRSGNSRALSSAWKMLLAPNPVQEHPDKALVSSFSAGCRAPLHESGTAAGNLEHISLVYQSIKGEWRHTKRFPGSMLRGGTALPRPTCWQNYKYLRLKDIVKCLLQKILKWEKRLARREPH